MLAVTADSRELIAIFARHSSATIQVVWPLLASGRVIGMGCMRLSTEADRDDARAVSVLHAALDAGVTLLDTADAYCLDEHDAGHNERLIARALGSWNGDRSRIVVATKGGLTRPQGRWIADGRASHLAAACEASLRALGVDRIDLYQLHAPDPRVPLATSVRALAALKRDGLVAHIGLCNVTVGQIEEARRLTDVDAIQVELSIWNDDNLLSGVAAYCVANGIRLIAHTPLGGPRRARRTHVRRAARRHRRASRCQPLRHRARVAHGSVERDRADSRRDAGRNGDRARRALSDLRLTDDDRARLDERVSAATRPTRRRQVARIEQPASKRGGGEVVLIMGLPGGRQKRSGPHVRRERLHEAEPRRRGRIAPWSAARVRGTAAVRRLAHRARQHLRVAQVAGGRYPGGHACRSARSLRLAADQRRGRAGERVRPHAVDIRKAPVAGGDAPGGANGCQRVRTGGPVPLRTKPGAAGSGRRFRGHRRRPVRAASRSVRSQPRADSLVRRRARTQPIRASARRRRQTMSRSSRVAARC